MAKEQNDRVDKVFISYTVYKPDKTYREEWYIPLAVFESCLKHDGDIGEQILDAIGQTQGYNKMTEKEQLFQKFFNGAGEKIDAVKMTLEQIMAWEQELELICLEAKATLQKVSQVKRERVEKLSQSERDKLITKPDILVSDALNGVKRRADKLSKADKLRESLRSLGLSEEEIIQQMSGIKIDETKKKVNEPVKLMDDAKKFTFNGTPDPIDENGNPEKVKVSQRDIQNESNAGNLRERVEKIVDEPPFDPSTLFG